MKAVYKFPNCVSGQHRWREIYDNENEWSNVTIKWCADCGCIVGDSVYDGRVNAGAVFKIMGPQIVNIDIDDTNSK